jgi:diaminopimelate epimerase
MTFSKYSASGNDFVIFHTILKKDYSNLAKKLCYRQDGVGADGMIVIVPHNELDFEWLFYNSDGSEANMCGNGTRACAHYAYSNNLASKSLSFLTGAGKISCIIEGNIVQTELTTPVEIKKRFNELGFEWYIVDTGVPHAVTLVDDLEQFDLEVCSKIRKKYNVNVNFALIQNSKIYVRTYERGVEDETLACGTGMAASFLRAYQLNMVDNKAFVYPKSGEELTLSIENDKLLFKGLVKNIFTGVLNENIF